VNLAAGLTSKCCRVWSASEAGLEDLEQVSNATESHFIFVLSEDPLIAWHTLESRILEVSYDEILERQTLVLEQVQIRGQSASFRYVR
jgi:hypothetical protein